MGDQNRPIFGIRRSGHMASDASKIKSLSDLRGPAQREQRVSVLTNEPLHANAEEINEYRRSMGRQ